MQVFVEQDCTIEHNRRKFTLGGAVVAPGYVIGYPKGAQLMDWHGNVIGACRVLSSWPTPRSHLSDRMYSYECFVGDVRYVGRGGGDGMILRARRSKRQGR